EVSPPWRQVLWLSSWRPTYVGATAQVVQSYSDGEATIDLFAAAYASQDQQRKLIGFNNRLEDGEQWRRVSDDADSLMLGGVERLFPLRRLTGREGSRSIWWIYWVDGRWPASAAEARIRYVVGKLLHGRSTAAVLVLSARGGSEATARGAVERFLRAAPALPA